MEAFLGLMLIFWVCKSAVDKGRKEYRSTRDHHAAQIARAHPDWQSTEDQQIDVPTALVVADHEILTRVFPIVSPASNRTSALGARSSPSLIDSR